MSLSIVQYAFPVIDCNTVYIQWFVVPFCVTLSSRRRGVINNQFFEVRLRHVIFFVFTKRNKTVFLFFYL